VTRLTLVVERAKIPADADEVFLWDGSAADSFKSTLGPSLDLLGPVPVLNADFVRIALAVYAADHTVKRQSKGSNWNSRDLIVSVPVSDPALWATKTSGLVDAVNFLTGDRWEFEFTALAGLTETTSLIADSSARVVLASGGADSGIGALFSGSILKTGETHTLVSHASSGSARTPQKLVHQQLETLFPGKQAAYHRVFISRAHKRWPISERALESLTIIALSCTWPVRFIAIWSSALDPGEWLCINQPATWA
jgi:hypothetical protein